MDHKSSTTFRRRRHLPHGSTSTIRKKLRSTASQSTASGSTARRSPIATFANSSTIPAMSLAEIAPKPEDYPGALPHMLKAGSLVFTPPKDPLDQRHSSRWWNFKFGANWRRPYGPRSSISGLDDHPVVHVAYRDAEAYAAWAGKVVTERRRMGVRRARRSRRRRIRLGRRIHARRQTHGEYLARRFSRARISASDGFERTSPVTAFPPNGYGAIRHDRQRLGVDWHWYAPKHEADAPKTCCIPKIPRRIGNRQLQFLPGRS